MPLNEHRAAILGIALAVLWSDGGDLANRYLMASPGARKSSSACGGHVGPQGHKEAVRWNSPYW
jgi:hypothetical protein